MYFLKSCYRFVVYRGGCGEGMEGKWEKMTGYNAGSSQNSEVSIHAASL